MAKTRGAHSYRPSVCRSSTPPADTSTPRAAIVAGPSPPGVPPSVAAAVSPNSLAVRPSAAVAASPAPAVVQGTVAADAEGSSSIAPAQRRYHTRVSPTPPAPSQPRPARRAPPPKRVRTSGPGESSTSRPRAPPSSPYQGIAGAPDPLHLLSGGLTSLAASSRGMLTAGEISTRRFTTISRHLPSTRSSETPCSSSRDTIWSHSWRRVDTIILG